MRNMSVARVIESAESVKYKAAVYWIAHNDESGDTRINSIKCYLTVCLVADTFGKTTFAVARAVLAERRKGIAHGRIIP